MSEHYAKMIRVARRAVQILWPEISQEGGCLYHAAVLLFHLHQRGWTDYRIQAGTAQWLRMGPEVDDGGPNLFGYVFEPESEQTRDRTALGLLPEMHVWIVDPVRRVLIDPSSGFFPAQCQKLQGLGWPGEAPPDFVWGSYDDVGTARYVADPVACQMVERIVLTIFREEGVDIHRLLRRLALGV